MLECVVVDYVVVSIISIMFKKKSLFADLTYSLVLWSIITMKGYLETSVSIPLKQI